MNPTEMKLWNKKTIEGSLVDITAFALRDHILLHEIVISREVFEELKKEKGELWRDDCKITGAGCWLKVTPLDE